MPKNINKHVVIQLKIYMLKNEMTLTDVSLEIGYARTHLSRVLGGFLKPTPQLLQKLEEFTKGEVKAESWIIPPRKQKCCPHCGCNIDTFRVNEIVETTGEPEEEEEACG